MTMDKKIQIFDTTLRDGEQSPGASMNLNEKMLVAQVLDSMGVDVIELGFPITSKGDFHSVSRISAILKHSTACALARAVQKDIETAGEALKNADNKLIHTFVATSPIHMKYKLNKTSDEVLELIKSSVTLARNFTDKVEWSAEDASRSELDFLYKAVELAIDSGASVINLPDTVGYATPDETFKMFQSVIEHVPNSHKAIFSVHAHDDLGLATANSLAGVKAGARQIECTINGLGERAGNTALEEVVMAIKVRGKDQGFYTDIDTTKITQASKVVATSTGISVSRNKAIVGANAFLHESGIHQDGVLKNKETYEIITPESIGLNKKSTITLGKHSGRSAFKNKLDELNIELSEDEIQSAFEKFKELGDQKTTILDEDIFAIISSDYKEEEEKAIELISYNVTGISDEMKHTYITLKIFGQEKTIHTSEQGTLGSLFSGINKLAEKNTQLKEMQINALTEGIDAQAYSSVIINYDDKLITGSSKDTDTVTSALNAYISAINKVIKFYGAC